LSITVLLAVLEDASQGCLRIPWNSENEKKGVVFSSFLAIFTSVISRFNAFFIYWEMYLLLSNLKGCFIYLKPI